MMRGKSLLVVAVAAGLTLLAPATEALAKYPPPVTSSSGQGTADPSIVGIGGCTTFSGGGFRPNRKLTITDNGTFVSRIRSARDGSFSTQVCFNSDARPGNHTLEASGVGSQGEPRTVSASVTVVGVSLSRLITSLTSANAGRNHGGAIRLSVRRAADSNGLPFSGFDQLLAVVAGLAVIVLLSMTLLLGELRYRRLRRRRANAKA